MCVCCGNVSVDGYARSLASYSLGDILKIIYLGFEKSQRSVTYDFLRYINILTYLRVLSGYKRRCIDGNSAGSVAMYSCTSGLHTATGPCHWPYDGPGQELRTSDHCQKNLNTVCRHHRILLPFACYQYCYY